MDHGQESMLCKLDKFLYGLKESHKQWHERFDNLIISNGFKVNEMGKCNKNLKMAFSL